MSNTPATGLGGDWSGLLQITSCTSRPGTCTLSGLAQFVLRFEASSDRPAGTVVIDGNPGVRFASTMTGARVGDGSFTFVGNETAPGGSSLTREVTVTIIVDAARGLTGTASWKSEDAFQSLGASGTIMSATPAPRVPAAQPFNGTWRGMPVVRSCEGSCDGTARPPAGEAIITLAQAGDGVAGALTFWSSFVVRGSVAGSHATATGTGTFTSDDFGRNNEAWSIEPLDVTTDALGHMTGTLVVRRQVKRFDVLQYEQVVTYELWQAIKVQ